MTQPHYIDQEAVERAERAEARISELAVMFGVPDGGRYLNDWKAVAETRNRRPAVNIALPKPALAQTDGYTAADELKAVIRQWLDADDPAAWGPFERALDGLISGDPIKCAVCGCLSLDGKAYFPAREGAKL